MTPSGERVARTLSPEEVLGGLPNAQRAVLENVIHMAEADARMRFVEICCSAARGAADELSDLDLGIGVDDEAWPDGAAVVAEAVRGMDQLVEVLEHRIPEWGDAPHLRVFAQFASGVQLDLVAFPASRRKGLPSGSVALYDPDARLATPMAVALQRATGADVEEWIFLGWVALLDLDKDVRRGSLWEALDRLHEARGYVWRLLAVTRGIEYPAFGLTSILDSADGATPPEMLDTIASADLQGVRDAGARLAVLLVSIGVEAAQAADARVPGALAAYTLSRLAPDGRRTIASPRSGSDSGITSDRG